MRLGGGQRPGGPQRHANRMIFNLMIMGAMKGFKQRSDKIGTAINLDCLG